MAHWIPIATVADCPPGQSLELVTEGRLVALFNIAGTFYALDGVCPHQGGPLAKGRVQGCVVTCPWHGWQFDLRSGCHQLRPSLVQPSFTIRTEGDTILIEMDD